MKIAIIILSDPQAGDEALGRAFNGLALAHAALAAGDEVDVVFNGAGTRWPAVLGALAHPAHALYQSVRVAVRGASRGCAAVFGATDTRSAAHLPLLSGNEIPGTPGLSDLHRYLAEGWTVLAF